MAKREAYESKVENYLLPMMEEYEFELVDVERRNGGPVSTELKTAILQESDPDQIAKWLDLVFDGISVQELEESIVK